MNKKINDLEFLRLEKSSYSPQTYYDFDQMKKKNLASENSEKTFSQKHLKIQMLYKQGLMQYLTDILMLDEYEKIIKKSALKFIPCTSEDQSVYQKDNMTEFEYIYLRNNLYIEKLEEKDLKTLEQCVDQTANNNDALLEVIVRTWQDIIKNENPTFNEEKFYIIYENTIDGIKSAPNDAVVLEIATSSEYDKNGNYVSLKNEEKKEAALLALQNQMSSDMNGILDIPVAVFIK